MSAAAAYSHRGAAPCFSACSQSTSLPVHLYDGPVASACAARHEEDGFDTYSNCDAAFPDEVDNSFVDMMFDDCLMNGTGPSYASSINTTSVYFDFLTLDGDLVEYRFSIVTDSVWGCDYSFGGDGGGIAAVLVPTCAIDAEPIACARTDPVIIEIPAITNRSAPLLDLVIPPGTLRPQTLYRIRVRTVKQNDCGCFSPCVAARVYPDPPPNSHCEDPFLLTRTQFFTNIPDIYGLTRYPTRAPTPEPTQMATPTASPTSQPTPSPVVVVANCSIAHTPDVNGTCQGPETACAGCICACYDASADVYFGACSTGYYNISGTLCPDPTSYNATSIDPVCRCVEDGFAVAAFFTVDNPTVLACDNGTLASNPMLLALVEALAEFMQISPSNVIISDAECGSYKFRLTLVDADAALMMDKVLVAWVNNVHDEAITPSLRDALELIRSSVVTVDIEPFVDFVPPFTPRCPNFTDPFPQTFIDVDDNGIPDECDCDGCIQQEMRGTAFPKLPTRQPTKKPTRSPTRQPTRVPTKLPTRTPTRLPTRVPTRQPSRVPTNVPTRTPTRNPTNPPTRTPTNLPTSMPTKEPTAPVPTQLPTKQPTVMPATSAVCPSIGRCTVSSGDAFAFCARAGQCPAGSVADRNVSIGESCLGEADPDQTTCTCCQRSCGSWTSSPCSTDTASGDFKTCVAAGTCVSRFRGVVSSLSCGGGGCECCNLLQTPPASAPTPPEQFINMCNGGLSDNVASGDEACDGRDLRGHSCLTLGFAGGTLQCTPWCDTYDASACTPYGACCNGTTVDNCTPHTTAAACTGSSRRFVANAPVCTPNLCAAAMSSYSAAVPSALQPAGVPLELGSQTIGAGSMIPNSYAANPASSCAGCFLGTAGGMLRAANGSYFVISNSHVWASPVSRSAADNCARPRPPVRGTLVTQANSCTVVPNGRPLGQLTAFSHLTPGGESRYDAALALVTPGPGAPWPVQMGLGAQTGGAPVAPALGMIVVKVSRTTGHTIGQIVGVDVTSYVGGSADDGSGASYVQTYTGQLLIWGISPSAVFSQSGDSGSMVFEFATMRGVGLLFAGSSSGRALVSPLGPILSDFFPISGGTVAGIEEARKRDLDLDLLRHFSDELPDDRFKPRGGGGKIITAPSRAAVGRVCTNQLKTLRQNRVLGELATNKTLVAHYVGFSPDDPTQPRIYVTVATAAAADAARASMPSHIDGTPISVQHGHPMKFH